MRTGRAALHRDRPFALFWAGQTVSQFGDRISELALPLIAVTALHASANEVAWLTALVWAPNLLAVLLGAWVDQHAHKQRLMIAADLARACVLLTLPVAHLTGRVTLGHLYGAALLTGVAGVVFNTAYPSFFAHLVPRSSYVDANSRLSASRSVSFVAGPALGGALVQALTAPVAVVADALTFLVSALLLRPIRVREAPVDTAPTERTSLPRRAGEGLTFVVRHPVLRASLGCATTVNFFTFVAGTGLIVLFADRELGLSVGTIGLALGIGSAGALLGAVIAPVVSRRIGMGPSITVGAVLFPAPLALLAAAGGPAWTRAGTLGAAEFLAGVGVMLFDVNLNSLQTAVIPDGMRSRVAGAYSTVNYGVRPVGAVAGGALATLLGLRATLVTAAVGGVLSVLWLLPSPVPRIRSLASDGPSATARSDSDSDSDSDSETNDRPVPG